MRFLAVAMLCGLAAVHGSCPAGQEEMAKLGFIVLWMFQGDYQDVLRVCRSIYVFML